MKKIIFFILFAFSSLFAEVTNSIPQTNSKLDYKKIRTYKDYKNFVNNLKQYASVYPKNAYFIFGSLYMQNLKLKDKTIKADFQKALYYFDKAREKGNFLAAYFEGVILVKHFREKYQALSLLENTLKKAVKEKLYEKNKKTYDLISNLYASIVLNYMRNDKDTLNKAANYLQFADANDNVSRFLMAHILYFQGGKKNIKTANFLLSSVCDNDNTPKDIKKICSEDPYIKGNEIKKCKLIERF